MIVHGWWMSLFQASQQRALEKKDEDTIIAEIVTNDGSLVDRFEVDRHTGRMRRSY